LATCRTSAAVRRTVANFRRRSAASRSAGSEPRRQGDRLGEHTRDGALQVSVGPFVEGALRRACLRVVVLGITTDSAGTAGCLHRSDTPRRRSDCRGELLTRG
jgi:hypothetical protein